MSKSPRAKNKTGMLNQIGIESKDNKNGTTEELNNNKAKIGKVLNKLKSKLESNKPTNGITKQKENGANKKIKIGITNKKLLNQLNKKKLNKLKQPLRLL